MPNLRTLKLAFNAYNVHQQSTLPVGIEYLSELKKVSAKIGGAGPEESHRRDAELAFRDAIRVHARCQRVNLQCVKQIIAGKDDQVQQQVFQQTEQSSATTVEYSPVLATRRKQKREREHNIQTDEIVTTVPYDDGYEWRKYGEKRTINSQFPRSYFRCTFREDYNCRATKNVQQCSNGDPPEFLVKYFNEHVCDAGARGPAAAADLSSFDRVQEEHEDDPMFIPLRLGAVSRGQRDHQLHRYCNG
ncbi:unnamed protein product [Urochloa humidicola]